jgi:hypothetical protein
MARHVNRLSALQVNRTTRPGRYADGGGLWLQITKTGAKSWLFRYAVAGREHVVGLGPLHTYSLAAARERARHMRQQLHDYRRPADPAKPVLHPLAARRATEAATRLAAGRTFRWAAEAYVKAHESGWSNALHRKQWRDTLGLPPAAGEKKRTPRGGIKPKYRPVCDAIGHLPVATIGTDQVLDAIRPMWEAGVQETATRTRGRIEKILDWARAQGIREGENPARWRGHLDHLLGKKGEGAHHAALPYTDLPALMAELRDDMAIAAPALEFTVLTAARTGEVIGARWEEVDVAAKLWTIPKGRMKSRKEHQVPLSPRAIAILAGLPRIAGNPHLFPGVTEGQGLDDSAMLEELKGMRPGVTVHGFRSTFRD